MKNSLRYRRLKLGGKGGEGGGINRKTQTSKKNCEITVKDGECSEILEAVSHQDAFIDARVSF